MPLYGYRENARREFFHRRLSSGTLRTVDLKQNYIINYVKIYNIRGSGIVGTNYETGLTNFCVDVKDSGNISRNSGNAFVFNKYYPGSGIFPNPYVTGMPNNITGRYIRIQTSGVGYLALAEVEVF